MKIPQFVLSALYDGMSQSGYLSMSLCANNLKPSDGSLDTAFELTKQLAERIDDLVEGSEYELLDNDREILCAERMIQVLDSVRQFLDKRYQNAAKEIDEVYLFLEEASECFRQIKHVEQIALAWKEFLAGENPVLDDDIYYETVKPLSCGFCNKVQTEVKKLIAGPNGHICNECIELCNEILSEDTI